jgi:hypothetical protein
MSHENDRSISEEFSVEAMFDDMRYRATVAVKIISFRRQE